jgi:hypothetical protein
MPAIVICLSLHPLSGMEAKVQNLMIWKSIWDKNCHPWGQTGCLLLLKSHWCSAELIDYFQSCFFSSLQDLIEDKPSTEALHSSLNITWSDLERRKLESQPGPEVCLEVTSYIISNYLKRIQNLSDILQSPRDDPANNQHLSAGEDNGEDDEEHVTSYLEQRPLKITSVDEVEKSPESHKSSSSGSFSVVSGNVGVGNEIWLP